MDDLQKKAAEWHMLRSGVPPAAVDGQQVEQSNSTQARSPNKIEKSSEPKNPKLRIIFERRGDGSDSELVRGGGRGAPDSDVDLVSEEMPFTGKSGNSAVSDSTSVVVCVDPDDVACAPRTRADPESVNTSAPEYTPGNGVVGMSPRTGSSEVSTAGSRVLRFVEDNFFISGYRAWYRNTEAVQKALSIFDDFRFGVGNPHRVIRNQDDPLVRDMRDSLGVEQIVSLFYGKVVREGQDVAFQQGVTEYGFRFSPDPLHPSTYLQAREAHGDALLSSAGAGRLFIGSWRGELVASPKADSLIITIHNLTSLNSYALHMGKNRQAGTPYGNVHQTIEVHVPIDHERLRRAVDMSNPTAVQNHAPGIIGDWVHKPKY
jgi:hypothetical protein